MGASIQLSHAGYIRNNVDSYRLAYERIMAIPGWGAVLGYAMGWLDRLIPSKKAALVDELNALNKKYESALLAGRDTEAAILRKQMAELRKKAGFTDAE
jgi:hypothetical protein